MAVTYCHNASHSPFDHSFVSSIDFHKFAFTLKLIDEKERRKTSHRHGRNNKGRSMAFSLACNALHNASHKRFPQQVSVRGLRTMRFCAFHLSLLLHIHLMETETTTTMTMRKLKGHSLTCLYLCLFSLSL